MRNHKRLVTMTLIIAIMASCFLFPAIASANTRIFSIAPPAGQDPTTSYRRIVETTYLGESSESAGTMPGPSYTNSTNITQRKTLNETFRTQWSRFLVQGAEVQDLGGRYTNYGAAEPVTFSKTINVPPKKILTVIFNRKKNIRDWGTTVTTQKLNKQTNAWETLFTVKGHSKETRTYYVSFTTKTMNLKQ